MKSIAAKDVQVGDTLLHINPARGRVLASVSRGRVTTVRTLGAHVVLDTTSFTTWKHPLEGVIVIPGSATCACGQPVEEDRLVYATPTCYACLPPPLPLRRVDA